MRRREFLAASALSAQTASSGGSTYRATGGAPAASDHKRRLENIAECHRSIRGCLRKHLITDYLPFHVVYNLGEYPARKPWNPDAWDEKHLEELSAAGVQLVQLHEEWNDSLRLFGADKFTPVNRPGFDRFVKMVHRRGMKLMVYASTGFFERRDPDFRPEWARGPDLVEIYWRYALCSPASPGWRAYLLPRLTRILDEFGVDGLYDDCGYRPLYGRRATRSQDEIAAFEETPAHDGAMEDLLGLVYAEVKRRRGIFKVHISANSAPRTNLRVYDYLWVGEGIRQVDAMRETVKNHTPYVAPCLDMSRASIDREDDLYLHSIPYMQFPLLLAGRPFTGERASVPGLQYQPEETDFWTRHVRNIGRYYKEHPEGPYSYGWWDSCPGRPAARPTYFKWLKRYRPMVAEGTWAYLEIGDSDLFAEPLPEQVVASAFANSDLYLVLANYSHRAVTVRTREEFCGGETPEAAPGTSWPLEARSLLILTRDRA
jgi:hypothetical protein